MMNLNKMAKNITLEWNYYHLIYNKILKKEKKIIMNFYTELEVLDILG